MTILDTIPSALPACTPPHAIGDITSQPSDNVLATGARRGILPVRSQVGLPAGSTILRLHATREK
jgi:hypothetical protein